MKQAGSGIPKFFWSMRAPPTILDEPNCRVQQFIGEKFDGCQTSWGFQDSWSGMSAIE